MRQNPLLLIGALLLLAASASAIAPSTTSYQGYLEDALGDPITGNVNLQFTIYNHPTFSAAANIKWTETHVAVPVTDGLFSVTLGTDTPILDTVFNQPNRWLGIKVGADPELSPRTYFSSVAYSHRVNTIDGSTGGDVAGTVTIDSLEVGNPALTGNISLYSFGIGGEAVRLWGDNSIGRSWVYAADGNLAIQTDGDIDGSGGYLSVKSGDGSSFTVDGNYNGTNDPRLVMSGTGGFIVLHPDTVGDLSTQLLTGAIARHEIFDEPGIAHTNFSGSGMNTGAHTIFMSRTISCPTDSYVLAIASCEASAVHTSGTTSIAWFGISNQSNSLPAQQDVEMIIPSSAPSGSYDQSISVHAVFPVTNGSHTFYFLGWEQSGNYSTNDMNLTLVFIPSSYGIVSSPAPPAPGTNGDDVNAMSTGLTQADLDAEQREAEQFNRNRLQAELDAMKVQLERIQDQLANDKNNASADNTANR